MADLTLNLGAPGKKSKTPGKKAAKTGEDAAPTVDAVLPPAPKALTSEESVGDGGVVTRMVVMQRDYGNTEKKPSTMSDVKL
jgi:hypothetical protein